MSPLSPGRLLLCALLFLVISRSDGRRRISQAQKAFDSADGVDWDPDETDGDKSSTKTTTTSPTTVYSSSTSKTTTTTEEEEEDDAVKKLLAGAVDLANLTQLVEREHADALNDALNRTVLWIDATYKAVDFGLNVSSFPECRAWRQHWNANLTGSDEATNDTVEALSAKEMKNLLKETELVDSKKRLKKLGLNEELLEIYKAVGLVYKEICGDHGRELWFSSTEDAKKLGIDEINPICEPFKEALNPEPSTLAALARKLNELIQNHTEIHGPATSVYTKPLNEPKASKTTRKPVDVSNTSDEEFEEALREEGATSTETRSGDKKTKQDGRKMEKMTEIKETSTEEESISSRTSSSTAPSSRSTTRSAITISPQTTSDVHATKAATTDRSTTNIRTTPGEGAADYTSSKHRDGDTTTTPGTIIQTSRSQQSASTAGITEENNISQHQKTHSDEYSDEQIAEVEKHHRTITTKPKPQGSIDNTIDYEYSEEASHESSTVAASSSVSASTQGTVTETTDTVVISEEVDKEPEDALVHVVEESADGLHTQTPRPPKSEDDITMYDDDIWDYQDLYRRFKVGYKKKGDKSKTRSKRTADKTRDDEDDWINEGVSPEVVDTTATENAETNYTVLYHWIEINTTDEINPTLLISSMEGILALGLDVKPEAFLRYEKVGLNLPGICADYVPKAIDAFNSSSFEGIEIEGPIGVNISALEAAGVNLTALAEKLRNDTEVDDILTRTEGAVKTLGGSFILPVLNKNQYDPFSAPIVFQGSAVVVRFGIYIESMSNFQTSTMDYDMDIYLMMAWRDARLVNPYDKPILVKEEEILEKIWRPDPFFANAKEAEFHEVTFLNFLMRIFPDGLVLYETRVKITPSCNLILCKYPHDKQTCDLLIKSFAYPVETVRFEWFSRRMDAIDKNPDVKLPELYIDRYEPTTCNKTRKSGAFSCLRAVFRLKRDVGFHIAQTYIPTSLALMFSWVGVWLPEEFMEGRIGVAITVLLTLSTESAGAREHLPSVSYLKAIDLWFGFITGFVFFTLLQTLFVIGFDKRANQMRKWAMKKKSDVTEELREAMLQKAKKYHKTGRYLDNFCRVFYPLSFLLFLIMYYFVFTEGRQDDCINRR